MTRRVAVVPCSGIGKALGAAAREAAYILTEDLRPGSTRLVALGLLVLGDPETRRETAGGPAVAIDGCALGCAAKGLETSGAGGIHRIALFDVIRRHRGLKPEGVIELNEDGLRLARVAAEAALEFVDAAEKADA